MSWWKPRPWYTTAWECRRLRVVHERITPVLRVYWVTESDHRSAVEMAVAANRLQTERRRLRLFPHHAIS